MVITEVIVGDSGVLRCLIVNVPNILSNIQQILEKLLYWIELDCTGVPNDVAGDCILPVYNLLRRII